MVCLNEGFSQISAAKQNRYLCIVARIELPHRIRQFNTVNLFANNSFKVPILYLLEQDTNNIW